MDEDMKQIRFTIPGQPFGKQRPKFSRAGAYVKTYTPKETTSYENLVKLFYNEAAKGKMFPERKGSVCRATYVTTCTPKMRLRYRVYRSGCAERKEVRK